MQESSIADFDRLVEVVERLATHVEIVHGGNVSARDDIANVLWLLIGEGDGYGLLWRVADQLDVEPPNVQCWPDDELPDTLDGMNVQFAIRATPPPDIEGTVVRPLSVLLDQHCLRFAIPGLEPESSWSWKALVKKVRNKFGGHADEKPPRWLSELRYYPAANGDVVAFLMWVIGQATLVSVTAWMNAHGMPVPSCTRRRYFNGIELSGVFVLAEGSKFDVRSRVAFEVVVSGRRQTMIGGMFDDEPFLFSIEANGGPSLKVGEEGTTLRELHRQVQATPSPMPPNRKARRTAEARRRRKR